MERVYKALLHGWMHTLCKGEYRAISTIMVLASDRIVCLIGYEAMSPNLLDIRQSLIYVPEYSESRY